MTQKQHITYLHFTYLLSKRSKLVSHKMTSRWDGSIFCGGHIIALYLSLPRMLPVCPRRWWVEEGTNTAQSERQIHQISELRMGSGSCSTYIRNIKYNFKIPNDLLNSQLQVVHERTLLGDYSFSLQDIKSYFQLVTINQINNILGISNRLKIPTAAKQTSAKC